MDFSSLPQYSGHEDDSPAVSRDRLDRSSLETSLGLVLAAVVVLVAVTALVSLLVLRLLPMLVSL
jgi:hypothetical protein